MAVEIVSSEPTPNERRDAEPVATPAAVVPAFFDPVGAPAPATALAVAAAVELLAATLGATEMPFPEDSVARAPNPIWALSKSKTEYTFFRKTSPTSQVFASEDWWPTMVDIQPPVLVEPI